MSAVNEFLAARDFLLQHRSDYATAYAGFKWPKLKEFNWALDYFDAMAKGNDNPALWIIEEDGRESKLSFAEMSARSNRVANWLRKQGVKRGERILIMLGNEVPLWETMLAAIKLGAVVIPATTLLTPEDLVDRVERGQVRHVVIGKAHTDKFENLPGSFGRIAVGGDSAGGTLALVTALQARDCGLPLTLQMLFYPGCAADPDTASWQQFGQGFLLDRTGLDWFFGQYLNRPEEREDWRFAPLLAPDLEGVAPVWLGLAECDPLLDEGLQMADRLRMAGVTVDLELYHGVVHEFIKMGRAIPEALQAHQDAARALRQAWAR